MSVQHEHTPARRPRPGATVNDILDILPREFRAAFLAEILAAAPDDMPELLRVWRGRATVYSTPGAVEALDAVAAGTATAMPVEEFLTTYPQFAPAA